MTKQPSLASQVSVIHPAEDAPHGTEWNQIRDALRGLRFGSVSIIVQDGVIVQIDRLEKRRVRKGDTAAENR